MDHQAVPADHNHRVAVTAPSPPSLTAPLRRTSARAAAKPDLRQPLREARARDGLGGILAATDPRRAAHHWRRALSHYRSLRSPRADHTLAQLSTLGLPSENLADPPAMGIQIGGVGQ